ncbi:MAG: ABC transporter substrate-binding protein [Chloroflexota bacterium]|nr:ABC transporter substrate-binding protein [Chloroflexota bacterium]
MKYLPRALAAPLLGLTAIATACAPTAPASPAPGAQQPAEQLAEVQTLTIGFPSVPANMDPHTNVGGTVRKFDIFETLVWLDDTGREVRPLLASEWRLVDPTTWRFTLRPGSKFQDGTPLTAEDVVFSWNRVTNPALRSQVPGNAPSIASITAIDLGTVEVKTKAPSPLLLRHIEQLAIVPKAYLERVGDEEFRAKPIGSGPFRLKEFRPDDRVVVTAWMEHPFRKPTLTEITIRAIPDQNARATGLRLKELDVGLQLNFEAAEALQREGLEVISRSTGIIGVLMDPIGGGGVEPGPIADRRVRQALAYAVNREELARGLFRGFAQPAGYLIREGMVGYNPDIKPYTFDPVKARQLLAEAGYPNGFKQDLEYWNFSAAINNTALYLQDQFKRNLNIDLELKPIEAAVFVQKIYKRQPIASLYLGGLGTGTDADTSLVWFWSENPSFGKRYNNPEYDRIYLESTRELDPARRERLLQQAVAILQEDPPWLGLVTNVDVSAWQKSVSGFVPRAFENGWPIFDRIKRVK